MTTSDARYRIGEVAQRAGVSTRTLRYYQELGLLDPAGASPGGNRRYSDDDVARLQRILELRSVMGFDLDRIAAILAAEDRLAVLRDEYHRGVSKRRHREIVREATTLNAELRSHVADKIAVLEAFSIDLEARAARLRDLADELGVDVGVDVSPGRPPSRAR